MDIGLQQTLQQAVEHGMAAYITSRRASIPVFIDRHFSFRGALALHRKTFGRDFYKHPVNLLWGLPVALVKSVADRPAFRAALERHLEEYGKTRGAVSELAGSLINLAAGYAALRKATPGALSTGTAAATAIAQHIAIAHFWLGSTLGAWYYAVFPVSASAGLVAATTGALIAAVGVVTALAWIVLDPLLATTGLHRRRLDRFVTALGEELRRGRRGDYRVRDHYIARVFDVLEMLRAA